MARKRVDRSQTETRYQPAEPDDGCNADNQQTSESDIQPKVFFFIEIGVDGNGQDDFRPFARRWENFREGSVHIAFDGYFAETVVFGNLTAVYAVRGGKRKSGVVTLNQNIEAAVGNHYFLQVFYQMFPVFGGCRFSNMLFDDFEPAFHFGGLVTVDFGRFQNVKHDNDNRQDNRGNQSIHDCQAVGDGEIVKAASQFFHL